MAEFVAKFVDRPDLSGMFVAVQHTRTHAESATRLVVIDSPIPEMIGKIASPVDTVRLPGVFDVRTGDVRPGKDVFRIESDDPSAQPPY